MLSLLDRNICCSSSACSHAPVFAKVELQELEEELDDDEELEDDDPPYWNCLRFGGRRRTYSLAC